MNAIRTYGCLRLGQLGKELGVSKVDLIAYVEKQFAVGVGIVGTVWLGLLGLCGWGDLKARTVDRQQCEGTAGSGCVVLVARPSAHPTASQHRA